jgi:hypothetical protein
LKEDAIMQPVVLTLITDYDMRIATVDMLSFMGGGAYAWLLAAIDFLMLQRCCYIPRAMHIILFIQI